jgi:prophage antirepressor-like protein
MNEIIIKTTTATVESTQLSISCLPIFKSTFTKNKELRVLGTYLEPWFIAKDVADFLGYKNTMKAIRDHVNEIDKISVREFKKTKQNFLGTLELHPDTILINESGMYSLMFSSKKEEAKKFKLWVTKDVIPSIRKTGEYVNEELKKQINDYKNQLQLKDKTYQEQLQIKDKELEIKDKEIEKIDTKHKQLLKRRKRTVYEIGNVVYILSNPAFEDKKIGESTQSKKETISTFTQRLSTYNTGSPHDYKVEYLIYLEENSHLEEALLIRYRNNLCQQNKEWIKDVTTKEIIEFIRRYCDELKIEYKEHIYIDLEEKIDDDDRYIIESDSEDEVDKTDDIKKIKEQLKDEILKEIKAEIKVEIKEEKIPPKHVKTGGKSNICGYCHLVLKDKKSVERHQERNEYCINKQRKYAVDKQKKINEKIEKEKNYLVCRSCKRKFKDQMSLETHHAGFNICGKAIREHAEKMLREQTEKV